MDGCRVTTGWWAAIAVAKPPSGSTPRRPDYSTASLEAVEIFTVTNTSAQDGPVRDAIIAYVGECLLRTGGDKWIWDEHPEHLTNGFPVVRRSITTVPPAHLIEYARARLDGRTFARVHRAWIAEAEDRRQRGHQNVDQREPTPGLDFIPEPQPAEKWAAVERDRFPQWVAHYGGGRRWDFSAASLDNLGHLILEHCPAGTGLLAAPPGDDFIDGVVWYFGETLHRATPAR